MTTEQQAATGLVEAVARRDDYRRTAAAHEAEIRSRPGYQALREGRD